MCSFNHFIGVKDFEVQVMRNMKNVNMGYMGHVLIELGGP